MSDFAPTSPELPANTGIVSTEKQFSDSLTQDLSDEDIKRALAIILPIKKKWQNKFIAKYTHDAKFNVDRAMDELSEFSDEITYTLATDLNILATVDVTPLLQGEGPIIEYIGVLPGHDLSKHGFDHERKEYEVKKAKDRGEDYLGQHGTTDAAKAKKRSKG